MTQPCTMNPSMPLPPNSVAISVGGTTETLAARDLESQSITALAAHTIAASLHPFSSAANFYQVMGVLALLGVSLISVPGIAQTPPSSAEDWASVLTSEAGLVVVPLHVYKNRKSVGGLGEQAFELVEDGVVQDIAFVEGPGERGDPAGGRTVPIEIILLVDVQHAVRIDLLDTPKIRDSFFEGIDENVAISVYGFADKLQRYLGPARDIARVQIALELAYSSGDGHIPIVDAIVATARDAASRTNNASRKLVVFSGGLNRGILGEAAHSALDFEIPIYDVVVSPQEPHTMPVRTRVVSFSSSPFMLGNQRPDTESAHQRQLGNWNPKRRTMPLHECCPLGMEMSREVKGVGTRTWTSGDSTDWTHDKSMQVRAYLRSLCKVAQNEYFVGYYPSRKGNERVARQVEIRLKSNRIGRLFGGKRVIVY